MFRELKACVTIPGSYLRIRKPAEQFTVANGSDIDVGAWYHKLLR